MRRPTGARVLSLALVCCACATASMTGCGPAKAPDHVGMHGMVLFGRDALYVSHIPMFRPPHDLQVIAEVAVHGGDTPRDFSDQQYTIAPAETFSLTDLARGTLTRFKGTIYRGNFEDGGQPLYPNIEFEVRRVLFQRPLRPTNTRRPSLDYVVVGPSYLAHVIDDPSSFDQIVATTGFEQHRPGEIVRLGDVNDVHHRLTPEREASCLVGPDFDRPCPAPAPEQAAPGGSLRTAR